MLHLYAKKAIAYMAFFCKLNDYSNEYKLFEDVLGVSLGSDLKATLEDIDREIEESNAVLAEQGSFSRLSFVADVCELNNLGRIILGFSLAEALYDEVKLLISNHFHNTAGFTLVDILEIIELPFSIESDYAFYSEVYERISLLIMPCVKERFFWKRPLLTDKRLIQYLCGKDVPGTKGLSITSEIYLANSQEIQMFVREAYVERIASYLSENNGVISLAGPTNSGMRHLLKKCANECERNLFIVDFNKIFSYICRGESLSINDDELNRVLHIIMREAIFYEASIVFYGVVRSEDAQTEALQQEVLSSILEVVEDLPWSSVVVSSEDYSIITITDRYVASVKLEPLKRFERSEMWRKCFELYELPSVEFSTVGSRYKLEAAEIMKAAKRLSNQEKFGDSLDRPMEQRIADVCEEVLPTRATGNLKYIKSDYTLDDLIIGEHQKEVIRAICSQVDKKQIVYDEWGMEKKVEYGQNVSALFCGGPGTGKTMAVHVIARMLHLPLYRVDLSQIVDKYIGETEKKLEAVFSTAEKSNVILFFDEADAIFGKRSDVKDSKDKYANTEVAYILQRIEEFDGIVILATNIRKNVDEAFMRRMKYVVEFPMPTAEVRTILWKSMIPDSVPSEEIDFKYLGENFEIAGGAIKNIIINALFLAADDKSSLQMKHILKALMEEKMKLGHLLLPKDFKQYEYIFNK